MGWDETRWDSRLGLRIADCYLLIREFSIGIVAEKDVKVLTYLTTRSDRAVVLNVICSLLNTVSSNLLPLCLEVEQIGPIRRQDSGKDRIASKDLYPLIPAASKTSSRVPKARHLTKQFLANTSPPRS